MFRHTLRGGLGSLRHPSWSVSHFRTPWSSTFASTPPPPPPPPQAKHTDPFTNPLAGVRVLDLSRILAGPWGTQLLADLGAEVIKVERPGIGDFTRQWGPPFMKDADGNVNMDESAYFMCCNRNKRSVTLDFSKKEGQEVIRRIAANSDVLVENFKVGTLAKYGLSYEDLKVVNPRLVYCSITGFGQTGPRATQPGYDFQVQAMGGLMSVTGEKEGPPQKVGVAISDLMTGVYASVGILAALRQRDTTGVGQHIDTALFDVQAAMLANQATNYLSSGEVPTRLGNSHPNIVPYNAVSASDAWFILAVGSDGQFQRFCQVANICDEVGLSDMDSKEWKLFSTNDKRVKNRELLNNIINPAVQKHPVSWWLEKLGEAGVPCGPINNIDQTFADHQAKARHFTRTVDHPSLGKIELPNHPFHMTGLASIGSGEDAAQGPFRAPPTLGQHTTEVLIDPTVCGLTQEELDVLVKKGIV